MVHINQGIRVPVEKGNPALQRIERLCIQCGQCAEVCKKMISVGEHFDIKKTDHAICIHCGQCIQVCPTNALQEVSEAYKVKEAIFDPTKTVVFMTSPSVRVALGEPFGKENGAYVEEKMVGALRKLGADYVFDTTFAADLTIMEEASELIDRVTNQKPLPQFTSCCPAWVKFVETYYPEYIKNISTSKSPISMFGPTVKSYFANHAKLDPNQIVTVALTPCTAKKYEIRRAEMSDALGSKQDTDFVITTKELANWMMMENIDLEDVEESTYDSLMPRGSGAGVIFGNSGGVMEAAVRTAYTMLTKETPPSDLLKFEPVRGLAGVKTCDVTIGEVTLHLAVISGTDHARRFLAEMMPEKEYHFVEVMTCPGGCISGGGQPQRLGQDMDVIRKDRMQALYQKDEQLSVRLSHENPQINTLYKDFYGAPLSALAKKMLHTSYQDRSGDLQEDPTMYASMYQVASPSEAKSTTSSSKWKCSICGYIYEGDITQEDDTYQCPICFVGKELFEPVIEEASQAEIKQNAVQYKCTICGYIYEGDIQQEKDTYQCPICFVGKELFEPVIEEASQAGIKQDIVQYKCTICGYIYEGDITQESDAYVCPICTVPKDLFEKL